MVDEIVRFPASGTFHYVVAVNVLLSLVGPGVLKIFHDFITQSLPHSRLHTVKYTYTLTEHYVQNDSQFNPLHNERTVHKKLRYRGGTEQLIMPIEILSTAVQLHKDLHLKRPTTGK